MTLPLVILFLFAAGSLAGLWYVMNGQIVALRRDVAARDERLFDLLRQNNNLSEHVASIATSSNRAISTNSQKMMDSLAANTREVTDSIKQAMTVVWTPQQITADVAVGNVPGYQFPIPEVADDTRWDGTDATDTLLSMDGIAGGHQDGIVADPARPPVDGGGFFGIAGLEPIA